jgi:sugar O-acyltransferase (sialic acid O-acetyltransferase NeuD family)
MENSITLFGASGHCKVIIDILEQNNQKIKLILDDNPNTVKILNNNVTDTRLSDLNTLRNVIISIGNNKVRKKISLKLNTNYATAIHPKAIISNHASIADGTVIMAGAIVNPNAKIGKHCIINSGAVIEHDCKISDFAHISPNASLAGGVHVGEGTQIGIGASVIQEIKIGKWALIGAGSVVICDIPDFAVAVGNPAKIIKYIDHNE